MEPNLGIEAVQKLAHMGYRFSVNGDKIRGSYEGQGDPDPAVVSPLVDLVHQNKDNVLLFLKCYCPRCGGVVFCPDLDGQRRCLSCDWEYLRCIYPALKLTGKQAGSGCIKFQGGKRYQSKSRNGAIFISKIISTDGWHGTFW